MHTLRSPLAAKVIKFPRTVVRVAQLQDLEACIALVTGRLVRSDTQISRLGLSYSELEPYVRVYTRKAVEVGLVVVAETVTDTVKMAGCLVSLDHRAPCLKELQYLAQLPHLQEVLDLHRRSLPPAHRTALSIMFLAMAPAKGNETLAKKMGQVLLDVALKLGHHQAQAVATTTPGKQLLQGMLFQQTGAVEVSAPSRRTESAWHACRFPLFQRQLEPC